MICDSHCHLDDMRYDEDFKDMLNRANGAGVMRFIIPAADPSDLKKAQKLASSYPSIYFATGLHPDLCMKFGEFGEEFFTAFLKDSKCIAIGECGLDYYRLDEKVEEWGLSCNQVKDLQKTIFKRQIKWANDYQKPLIVHIRDASGDSLEILLEACKNNPNLRGVLHCFNADMQLLKLSRQFYYGIGGVLTFKNARKLVEILPKIPKDRLLLETDAPYLTPHPHRGTRNEPAYIPLVLDKMAEILGDSVENLQTQIAQNNKELFGI